MAAKKKTAKRKAPARRSTRRPARTAGFQPSITNLAMAIGGALLANAYIEKVPVKDPKLKYGLVAGGSIFAMRYMPQLAPALLGVGVFAGAKAAMAIFPAIATALPGSSNTGTNLALGAGIGRLTAAEEQRVRAAVQARGGRMNGAGTNVIVGAGDAVIVGGYSGPWT
jgi:hypothetical protein